MRLPRIAAIALLGTAATAVSATSAFADDCHHPRIGHIAAAPKVVWSGHNVQLSTKSCTHWEGPAKASVKISGKRHTVWLNHHTKAGLTGWLHVPSTARTQHVAVWGHCAYGPALKGSFTVKHPKPVVRHRPVHHWTHKTHHWTHEAKHWNHHECGCQHSWNKSDSGWMKHHADTKSSGYLKHHPEKQHTAMKKHTDTKHTATKQHTDTKHTATKQHTATTHK